LEQLLQKYHQELVRQDKSTTTIQTYLYELQKFNSWLGENQGDLKQLTRYEVKSYMEWLESEGKSATTIHKIFAALSSFAGFLGRSDITENINLPKFHQAHHISPQSLERNEKNRLLREVERDQKLRNIAITYVLLLTGMRVSELVGLNREDIELGERKGSVLIRKGKGNTERRVPLSSEARFHLKRYLESRSDQEAPLFLSNFGKRISIRSVQHMLSQYGVHPHQLRHTFCRELVAAGVDLTTIADLAGHQDINLTRRYTKPSEKELQETIDRVFT